MRYLAKRRRRLTDLEWDEFGSASSVLLLVYCLGGLMGVGVQAEFVASSVLHGSWFLVMAISSDGASTGLRS